MRRAQHPGKGAGAPTGIGAPEGRARGVSSLGLGPEHFPPKSLPVRRRKCDQSVKALLAGGLFGPADLVHHGARHQAGIGTDLLLDLVRDLRVLLEESLGVLAALADALAVVG